METLKGFHTPRAEAHEKEEKRSMKRFNAVDKEHWWITARAEAEGKGTLVPIALARKDNDFSRVRSIVWAWFRRECGRTELSVGAKLMLWALCERWRYETWSSHDAISYYAKMTGVNRKTAGRGVGELIDQEIIWCVLEGEQKRLRRSQAKGRKHFLLVGLIDLVRE